MARKLQADEWLFAATVGLALFGVVMVYSASAVMAAKQNHTEYHYVIRQAIWTAAGLIAMWLAMQFDYQRLRNSRIVYGLLGLSVVLLIAVFLFPPVNGARRWIRFQGSTLQPSEIAKLALAIFLARFLERRAGEEGAFWTTFVPSVALAGGLALLVVAEPDLGTAMMLAVVTMVVLYTAGARIKHLLLAAAPALVGLVALLVFVPFRLKRMMAFLDPWADPQGSSYQVVQSLIAVGSGGVDGLGFTQGRQKMFFLPFAHSDFIFAVVSEELGLLGALALVLVFGFFLWRGMRAALNAPDRFGMLLGVGIVTGIVAQALFNISVVLSLMPTKGIPLPFISYGGSSMVFTLFAVGVLLNISQQAALGGAGVRSVAGDAQTARRADAETVPARARRPVPTQPLPARIRNSAPRLQRTHASPARDR
ncbi:MAG TPA: putative lipid II flippase FtsW [Pyrinomonadaceae bacterium]|jgi:cell division protein FtsW|nr:putative lipid II flippase FtsW [Pyrinomonadaceae bacterium]